MASISPTSVPTSPPAPPSILGAEELVEVVVLLNGSGQLPCEVQGSPAPTISWFRGRRPLPSGTRTTYVRGGRALRVSGAQEADAGLYVCLATNPAGTAHRTVRLEVYGKAPGARTWRRLGSIPGLGAFRGVSPLSISSPSAWGGCAQLSVQ